MSRRAEQRGDREGSDELRRRLREAEDTLEAIRQGEVDAVVVDGAQGKQIYTLESPDQPFRIFVEQMQEGALTVTLEGTILYCNRFFSDMVSRPLEQVRGQSIFDFVAPDDQDAFDRLLARAQGQGVRGECHLLGGDGENLPVQLAFNPLPAENFPTFGVVITDLRERERAKRLEAERMAAEEANAARDKFLAVVSHELRTPLNAVLGWTQLLQRQHDLPSSARRGLEIIERSAWSQSQLIDDLLDVSRVLAGKLRLELRPVSMNRIVEASVGVVQPSAESKGVRVEVFLPDNSPVVRGDADRLQQMAANLLSNAVKFTPEGGRVSVTLTESGGMAELDVTDTGIGIPGDYLPRLFELYQQIEGSTTRRAGGLGLGLAIVKELTELHGGSVQALSPGKDLGATFIVRLPLLESSAVDATPVEEVRPDYQRSLEGVSVLLVEDEDTAREMLTEVLEAVKVRVVAVPTAGDALRVLEEQPVELLVSDIGLPGMDGYELIRKIRSGSRSRRRLPAIALTAFAGRDDRRRALVAGYQVHLSKPVDQSELYAAISSLAGH